MMPKVISLRPLKDFYDLNVYPSRDITVMELGASSTLLKQEILKSDGIILPAVGSKLDSSLFEGSKIKLIQVTGAGFDRLNVAELSALGIPVANIPGGSASAVSEYVVSVALSLLRNLNYCTKSIIKGEYSSLRNEMISAGINQLSGLTVGIIGYGKIGRSVHDAFEFFGANVKFYDPFVKGGCELNDVLRDADLVSVHVPLSDETKNLLGNNELKLLKSGAILINASRGGIVPEELIVQLLNQNHLGGAAIDVFYEEPVPIQNCFLKLNDKAAQRIILTPHLAGISRQAWRTLFEKSWANIEKVVLNNAAPEFVVNNNE